MDPINPWLDPAEVRRMAERLIRPAAEPVALAGEAGFGASFVGFASPRAATQLVPVSDSPHHLQEENQQPSAGQQPPPGPSVPLANGERADESADSLPPAEKLPAVPPSPTGNFLERIQKFTAWLHQEFSASGVFILDRDGAVIFDESGHGRLHFLAKSLAHASRRQNASTANVHVKIGAHATLEVIPVSTAYGTIVLGLVVPEALLPTTVREVMQALNTAAAPKNA